MRIDGGFYMYWEYEELFEAFNEIKELDRLDMQQLKEKLSLEQFDDVITRKTLLLEKIEQKPIAYHLDTIV
ncbi:Imm3 family immunity protein [Brevibacillus fortis]|uniref:Imm3 family immunity protein n=1 Tax=Brevibacillus fortis TaxID=2126352 RepID=UPI002E1AD7FB|nr:Imm3 family immunity protein [Brevibacillus fortis]